MVVRSTRGRGGRSGMRPAAATPHAPACCTPTPVHRAAQAPCVVATSVCRRGVTSMMLLSRVIARDPLPADRLPPSGVMTCPLYLASTPVLFDHRHREHAATMRDGTQGTVSIAPTREFAGGSLEECEGTRVGRPGRVVDIGAAQCDAVGEFAAGPSGLCMMCRRSVCSFFFSGLGSLV